MSLTVSYKTYAIVNSQTTPFYIDGTSYQTIPTAEINTAVQSKFRHLSDLTIGGVITVLEGEVDS